MILNLGKVAEITLLHIGVLLLVDYQAKLSFVAELSQGQSRHKSNQMHFLLCYSQQRKILFISFILGYGRLCCNTKK